MNSHDGGKKTDNNQTASASTFEKIMSAQNNVSAKIFSYLDLKSRWNFSNVNRLVKQKFLDMSRLDESNYELSCNFLNFVHGRGNFERLSKIVDEAVEHNAAVYENKTPDELRALIPIMSKENYNYEKSIFYQMDNIEFYDGHDVVKYSLVKEMIWHMVLFDVLNIKILDFERKKSLPEEISDIVKQNSQNRLNFLFKDVKEYDNFRYGGFAAAIYDYAKLIFELPDKNTDVLTDQKELIKKIFACFIKVSFLRMEQAKQFEPYKNDLDQYEFYRDAILHLKRCFYMCNKPYKSLWNGIDSSDFWNFETYIHTDARDMANYLFLTNELEDLFETNEDFVYDFGFDYYHAADYEYSHFGAFLLFLNKIKPLEERYTENKDKFMKMFIAVKNVKWGYWDFIEHVQGVVTLFENEKLRQNLIDDMTEKFKNNFGRDSERVRWRLFRNMCKSDDIFEKGDFIEQINSPTFQAEETKEYFGCLIKHFTDNNDYNQKAIEMVSNEIFGDGKITFSDRLSYLNKSENTVHVPKTYDNRNQSKDNIG